MSLERVIVPSRVVLDEVMWRAAGTLAGLRRASNERIRSSIRDRGTKINIQNDVLGAVAELIALRTVSALPDVEVEHSLYNPTGPVDGVDLRLNRRRQLLLEVKGHFVAPNKRYLAINDRAHVKSQNRKAEGYLPVISAMGASWALVGRIIPLSEVSSWPVRTLGSHGDPARLKRLEDVYRDHFDGLTPAEDSIAFLGASEEAEDQAFHNAPLLTPLGNSFEQAVRGLTEA